MKLLLENYSAASSVNRTDSHVCHHELELKEFLKANIIQTKNEKVITIINVTVDGAVKTATLADNAAD